MSARNQMPLHLKVCWLENLCLAITHGHIGYHSWERNILTISLLFLYPPPPLAQPTCGLLIKRRKIDSWVNNKQYNVVETAWILESNNLGLSPGLTTQKLYYLVYISTFSELIFLICCVGVNFIYSLKMVLVLGNRYKALVQHMTHSRSQ